MKGSNPMGEDAGSLDRDRFRYFPVVPGRMEFAIEVRRALLAVRPDVVAAISNAVAYANPNQAATKLVDPALSSDPNVYPPQAVRARLFFDKPVTPEYERLRTRAWTRIKTGS